MKVNLTNVSFGRILFVKMPYEEDVQSRYGYGVTYADQEARDIGDTMEGETSAFGRETSRKMGEFLKAQIGDFDEKKGYRALNIRGKNYIFTGDDVEKSLEIQEKASEKNKEFERNWANNKKLGGKSLDGRAAAMVRYGNMCVACEELEDLASKDAKENGEYISIEPDETQMRIKEVVYHTPFDEKVFNVQTSEITTRELKKG